MGIGEHVCATSPGQRIGSRCSASLRTACYRPPRPPGVRILAATGKRARYTVAVAHPYSAARHSPCCHPRRPPRRWTA
eukprot:scaffold6818_cov103-Isochrysis_galbana.AAC.3